MKEDLSQQVQIEGTKVEKNQLINLKALKANSGNVEKQLRTRQKTYSTFNLEKTMRAAIKPMISQERLVKKKRIKTWKQVIIQKVEQKIQAIQKGYKKAFKTQKHKFLIEFKRINRILDQIETQSTILINEVTVLKTQKMATTQYSTQDMTKTHDILKISIKPIVLGFLQLVHLEKQYSYATVAVIKPVEVLNQS